MSAAAQTRTADTYLTWGRDLTFSDSAASSSIQVYLDPRNGFLVADGGQSQIRAYSDSAQLLWSVGRAGGGPSEFQQLRSVARTPQGQVVALDNTGKVSIFGPSGTLVRTAPTGLSPAYNSWLLNDTTLLISGRFTGNSNSPLLHVWSLNQNRILASFFNVPAHDPAYDEAYRFSGWANAAVLGRDSIAVVFPLADTLYLYHSSGREIGKFKLPLDNFRRLSSPGPKDDAPESSIEWRQSYTRISQVFRSPDGSIYVQYFNLKGLEPAWGFSRMFLDRDHLYKRFEIQNTNRLLGVSPKDSMLYFLRADLLESTVWSLAHVSQ
jgi:hypothetical protein